MVKGLEDGQALFYTLSSLGKAWLDINGQAKSNDLIKIKEGKIKCIICAVGLVVLVFGVAILAQTQTGGVEQELMKLEIDWANAYIKRDADSMNKILADDYMGTDWANCPSKTGVQVVLPSEDFQTPPDEAPM